MLQYIIMAVVKMWLWLQSHQRCRCSANKLIELPSTAMKGHHMGWPHISRVFSLLLLVMSVFVNTPLIVELNSTMYM